MKLDSARTLTVANASLSLALSAALFAWYWSVGSSLALGQAADSLLDVLTAVLLAWAVGVAAKPRDQRHPAGHRSAEPLAALWVSALALLLAYRVAADAIGALWSGNQVSFSVPLLLTFVLKAAIRGGLVVAIDRSPRESLGPAVRAMRVDARNDTLLSLGSTLAVVVSRWVPWADPAVALPLAAWIGYSGFELARENTALLMGEAPPPQRLRELRALVMAIDGVLDAHDLSAHALGAKLGVRVHVEVDGALSAAEAHDLGERVRHAVEGEADVDRCDVHLDVRGHAEPS